MLQNLQNFAKFQKIQLENLVDFEKCCKTRICSQRSAPIQPKTSEILPKICRKFAKTWQLPYGSRSDPPREAVAREELGVAVVPVGDEALLARRVGLRGADLQVRVSKIGKFLQIFGGLVLGCIKTKFCKKICV